MLLKGKFMQTVSVLDCVFKKKCISFRLRLTTFDRGTEFASFRDLNIQTYFCNPHSPWQKGSNENFNGRLRRYLPKKYNSRNLSQVLLDEIAMIMNNQPRKCLDFKTPFEVFCNTRTHSVAL